MPPTMPDGHQQMLLDLAQSIDPCKLDEKDLQWLILLRQIARARYDNSSAGWPSLPARIRLPAEQDAEAGYLAGRSETNDAVVNVLCHYWRAKTLFENDRVKSAKVEIDSAIAVVAGPDDVTMRIARSSGNSNNHGQPVAQVQLAVFQNSLPVLSFAGIAFATATANDDDDNQFFKVTIHARAIHRLAGLISSSIAALSQVEVGSRFKPIQLYRPDNMFSEEIFRILPRSPFPSHRITNGDNVTVHLALVNEMNLFPQAALGPEEDVVIDVTTTTTVANSNTCLSSSYAIGVNQSRPNVGNLELQGLDHPGFHGSSKGAVTFRMTVDTTVAIATSSSPLFLKFAARADSRLAIVPLILGPFNTDDEVLQTFRPLYYYKPDQQLQHSKEADHVSVKESTSDLPGKMWDSAFFVATAARDFIVSQKLTTVLDLSSGNGAVGLYLAKAVAGIKVTITDVPDALSLICENRQSICPDQDVRVRPLLWGHENEVLNDDYELVIACDLIYESELTSALIWTINRLVKQNTTLLLGYKPRGMTAQEKDAIWARLAASYDMQSLAITERTIGCGLKNDAAGAEIWQVRLKSSI
ncbi:putative methyltransferase-domain-containing protein [Lipomyces japonicus]|uniref:putative methyltransferase-domain-containing protein n=1 Tax=Lipomyces japonicus TaxID=56871 RepID=UPI0034CF48B6